MVSAGVTQLLEGEEKLFCSEFSKKRSSPGQEGGRQKKDNLNRRTYGIRTAFAENE